MISSKFWKKKGRGEGVKTSKIGQMRLSFDGVDGSSARATFSVRTVTPSSSAARAGAVSSRAAHRMVRDIVSLIMVYVFSVCNSISLWAKKVNPQLASAHTEAAVDDCRSVLGGEGGVIKHHTLARATQAKVCGS